MAPKIEPRDKSVCRPLAVECIGEEAVRAREMGQARPTRGGRLSEDIYCELAKPCQQPPPPGFDQKFTTYSAVTALARLEVGKKRRAAEGFWRRLLGASRGLKELEASYQALDQAWHKRLIEGNFKSSRDILADIWTREPSARLALGAIHVRHIQDTHYTGLNVGDVSRSADLPSDRYIKTGRGLLVKILLDEEERPNPQELKKMLAGLAHFREGGVVTGPGGADFFGDKATTETVFAVVDKLRQFDKYKDVMASALHDIENPGVAEKMVEPAKTAAAILGGVGLAAVGVKAVTWVGTRIFFSPTTIKAIATASKARWIVRVGLQTAENAAIGAASTFTIPVAARAIGEDIKTKTGAGEAASGALAGAAMTVATAPLGPVGKFLARGKVFGRAAREGVERVLTWKGNLVIGTAHIPLGATGMYVAGKASEGVRWTEASSSYGDSLKTQAWWSSAIWLVGKGFKGMGTVAARVAAARQARAQVQPTLPPAKPAPAPPPPATPAAAPPVALAAVPAEPPPVGSRPAVKMMAARDTRPLWRRMQYKVGRVIDDFRQALARHKAAKARAEAEAQRAREASGQAAEVKGAPSNGGPRNAQKMWAVVPEPPFSVPTVRIGEISAFSSETAEIFLRGINAGPKGKCVGRVQRVEVEPGKFRYKVIDDEGRVETFDEGAVARILPRSTAGDGALNAEFIRTRYPQYKHRSVNESLNGRMFLVDFTDPRLVGFLNRWGNPLREALGRGEISVRDAMVRAFEIVRDNIRYDKAQAGTPGVVHSLGEFTNGAVCNGQSQILQVLLQYLGIESRMIKGYYAGGGRHAWVHATDPRAGGKLILDPAQEAYYPEDTGGYRMYTDHWIDDAVKFARERLGTIFLPRAGD